MRNKKASWWDPDKIIKDLLWKDLTEASRYANGKLLDVGCGEKPYLSIFRNRVESYIGIDLKNKKADIKADFLKTRFKNSEFQTILCTQVIEHVEDPIILLKKINKILTKNGVLIMTAPFVGSLHEIPQDFYRFSKFSLISLLKKSSFRIIYIKEEGNWISSISIMISFYLESTFNKYYLRYIKKILMIIIQFLLFFLSLAPNRFTKKELCPINYIIVAKKSE